MKLETTRRRLCLKLIFTALLACSASAQDDTASDSDDDTDPGYHFILKETKIVFSDNGQSVTRIHNRIAVDKDKAVDATGDVNIPYNAFRGDARVVEAFTLSPDGKKSELSRDAIHDKIPKDVAGFEMYTDVRSLSFSMPAVHAGAIIDYDVEITEKKPVMPGEFFATDFFDMNCNVATSRIAVTFPARRTVKIATQSVTNAIYADVTNGSKRNISWELRDVPKPRYEYGMPPAADVRPGIHLTSVQSWDDVARWYEDLAKKPMRDDRTVIQQAKKLTAGLTNEIDRIRALYRYASRDVRYVGLELGRSAYEPHAVGDTLKNRYGDCKDKASLLVAMLRAINITGHVALVRPNYFGKVQADMPSPGEFNHAIVNLPRPDGDWWIDATMPYADVNEHHYALDDCNALVPGSGTNLFVNIPIMNASHSIHRLIYELDVHAGGYCIVTNRQEYVGRAAIGRRAAFARWDVAKYREQAEKGVKQSGGYARLLRADYGDPADETKPFIETVAVESDAYMQQTRSGYSLQLNADELHRFIDVPNPNRDEDRKHKRKMPWVSRTSHTEEIVCNVHLAEGLKLKHPPTETKLEFPQGIAELKFEDGATPVVTLRVTSRPTQIEAADLPAIASRVERAMGRIQATIEVEDETDDLLDDRQYAKVESILLAAVSNKPASVEAQMRLGKFYARIGRTWRAQKAYEKVIDLAPADPRGYKYLAWNLSGVWGTPGPGFNRIAIDELFKRAISNLPEKTWARKSEAMYCLYDDNGRADSEKAPLKRAEEIYRKLIKDDPRDHRIMSKLGSVLCTQKRYDEAEDWYRKAIELQQYESSYQEGLWLTLALAGHIDEAYNAIASYTGQGSAQIASEATRIAAALMLKRHYDDALTLYDKIQNASDNPETLRPFIAVLRKLSKGKRDDYATFFDTSSPEAAVRTANVATILGDRDRLRRATDAIVPDSVIDAIIENSTRLRRSIGPETMLMGADCLVSGFESHSRKLDGGDIAVVIEPPLGIKSLGEYGSKSVNMQVTPDGKSGWKLIGLGDPSQDAETFAKLALRNLRSGDIASAAIYQNRIAALCDRNGSASAEKSLPFASLSDLSFSNDTARIKAWIGKVLLAYGEQNDYRDAADCLQDAAKAAPEYPQLQIDACVAQMNCGRKKEMLAQVDAINPDQMTSTDSLSTLGNLLTDIEHYDAANRVLKRLQALDRNAYATHWLETSLLLHRGQVAEATAAAQNYWEQGERTRHLALPVIAWLAPYTHDEAIVRRAIDTCRQPDEANAYTRRTLYSVCRDLQMPRDAFEQIACGFVDGDATASPLIHYAELAVDSGNNDEARDLLHRAELVGGLDNDLSLLHPRAIVLSALGQHEAAAALLNKLAAKRDADDDAYCVMFAGVELRRAGKTREADDAFNAVLAREGELEWPKLAASYFLGKASEQDLARYPEEWKSAPIKSDHTCEMNFIFGCRREIEGDKKGAIAAYEACLKTLAGKNIEYHLAAINLKKLQDAKP